LSNVNNLVSGLVAQLNPILGSLLPTIMNLNLSSIINALGLLI
jgi:hypothetical protein